VHRICALADALEDDALQIVVQDAARDPAERLERERVAAQEERPRRPVADGASRKIGRNYRFRISGSGRVARGLTARALRRAIADPARGAAVAAGVSHGVCARDRFDKPRNLAKCVTVE